MLSFIARRQYHKFRHQPAIGPRLSESFLPCVLVPEGFVGILEGFRKYSGVLQSGINCVVPCYHRVTLVDKRIIQIDTPPQTVYSKDNQQLTVDCAFYYRINDPVKALYNVQNLEESLKQLFSRSIISIIGKAEAAEIIDSSREKLATQVLETMNDYIQDSSNNFTNQCPKNTSGKGKEKDRHTEKASLRMIKTESYQTFNRPLAPSSERTESPAADGWEVDIVQIAITSITYPAAIMKALNEQRQAAYQIKTTEMQAAANLKKVATEAEANKEKTRLQAEADKLKAALEAEGRAYVQSIETKIQLETAKAKVDAELIKANGEATRLLLIADADNRARQLEADLLEKNPIYTKQKALEIKASALGSNSKVIFMNPDKGSFFSSFLALQESTKAVPASTDSTS